MKKLYYSLLAIAVILLCIFAYSLTKSIQPSLTAAHNRQIDLTSEQITSIQNIGQWEFLAVSDEELIDTVRRGIFSDDRLARIYYGTVRIGTDMRKMDKTRLRTEGDSVFVTLPPIQLLDSNFIDEARTRSFHESGRWSGADREALYRRARSLMMRQALTQQNLHSAQANGEEQVKKLFRAMGFPNVIVRFEP